MMFIETLAVYSWISTIKKINIIYTFKMTAVKIVEKSLQHNIVLMTQYSTKITKNTIHNPMSIVCNSRRTGVVWF